MAIKKTTTPEYQSEVVGEERNKERSLYDGIIVSQRRRYVK